MPESSDADVDVIAVTGACAQERGRCARSIAEVRGFVFVPAEQTGQGLEAVDRAVNLMRKAIHVPGVVLEYPLEVPVMEIVGFLTAPDAGTALLDLVCVLDVGCMLADLDSEELIRVPLASDARDGGVIASKAELLVAQIEFASTIAVVNGSSLQPKALERAASLLSHLAPSAEQRLVANPCSRHGRDGLGGRDGFEVLGRAGRTYVQRPPDAGWVAILNQEFPPQRQSCVVEAIRYEQYRPFHPGRLNHALKACLFQGHCGHILRSAGFARLATRPHITAQWDQVGRIFTLSPLAFDDSPGAGAEFLAFGQDLAFIGTGLDELRLRQVLDEAALSDAELEAGPMEWAGYPDEFPAWSTTAT
ncbi:Cobalamin synthesis protein cobW C-terminal domain-containing protein [Brevibacterium sp. 239c]|uniref:GTP-binding protein n=1 Tax=Brevibacterium sp. 239c TaxID=1965356 RepID=UPI000C3F92E0|nr:GTP-binding protein [Brevibacterium sp. 239c]SMX98405.1 Cobalamin synthesis protein cobW C-terminal domain-containing protein [Brevibacterium sp. 239c]